MTDDTHPAAPRHFTVVDAEGQIRMRGQSLDLPQIPGLTTIEGEAPANTRRHGNAWVPVLAPVEAAVGDPRLRDIKLAQINQRFAEESAALTAGYPIAERQTWPAQEIEALAWGADLSSPTPYLDGIAAVRGITPLDMREKTLEAVNAFRAAAQWLVGTRQALRDAIQNPAATHEQIAAIVWPASPSQE